MYTNGYVKIANEADRATVAQILFKHGYTVQMMKRKKSGRAYDYFVHYELRPAEMPSDQPKEEETEA